MTTLKIYFPKCSNFLIHENIYKMINRDNLFVPWCFETLLMFFYWCPYSIEMLYVCFMVIHRSFHVFFLINGNPGGKSTSCFFAATIWDFLHLVRWQNISCSGIIMIGLLHLPISHHTHCHLLNIPLPFERKVSLQSWIHPVRACLIHCYHLLS